MPPSRVQTLRSSTKKQRPAQNSREVGELFVNFPDLQLGVIDPGKTATDLIAIRFFSATTDYAIGDYVIQAGQLYRAKSAVTAAVFNATQWDLIYNKAQVDAALATKLDTSAYTAADVLAKMLTVDGVGSGLDADRLDGQDSSFYAVASSLNAYAPLASPVFTGDPKAPTATLGDSDTSIATTAFVAAAITNLNISGYATLASPNFTGDPKAPTPGTADNDTSIATTAYVQANLINYAPLNSPIFTGDARAVTPATADSDTSIATTAFVKAQGYIAPDAPSDGVSYGRKNGTWVASVGGAAVSDAPPGAPLINGQLFFESDTGALYVWYDDGNSQQWVMVGGPGTSQQTDYVRKTGDTMGGNLTFPVGTTVTVAGDNAMLMRNRIVNGGMQISQELGSTQTTVNAAYPADQWVASVSVNGNIAYERFAAIAGDPSRNYVLRVMTGTTKASLAAGDYFAVLQNIEGIRTADFFWGLANAKPVILRFSVWGTPGTYAVSLGNNAGDRSYVASFTITTANTWQDVIVKIPAVTTGTWPSDNTRSMYLTFAFAVGSTYCTPTPNAWANGYYYGITGMTNGWAATGNAWKIANVGLYLDDGSGIPPRWEMPDEASELIACMRYWWRWSSAESAFAPIGPAAYYSTTQALTTLYHPVKMRVAPAVAFSAANTFGLITVATAITADVQTTFNLRINVTTAATTINAAGLLGANAVTTAFIANNARM